MRKTIYLLTFCLCSLNPKSVFALEEPINIAFMGVETRDQIDVSSQLAESIEEYLQKSSSFTNLEEADLHILKQYGMNPNSMLEPKSLAKITDLFGQVILVNVFLYRIRGPHGFDFWNLRKNRKWQMKSDLTLINASTGQALFSATLVSEYESQPRIQEKKAYPSALERDDAYRNLLSQMSEQCARRINAVAIGFSTKAGSSNLVGN